MKQKLIKNPLIKNLSSQNEDIVREQFIDTYKKCPIPENELLTHIALFLKRQDLGKILLMDEMYRKILATPGAIMEFGTRWGRNAVTFENLRAIYEPYHHARKIVAFDSFNGFPNVHKKDGADTIATKGAYSTTKGYEMYLEKIMDYHEKEAPLSHIRKYEIVKGDVIKTIHEYLDNNPETIVALAYFDLDLYEPTLEVLKAIQGHLTKGSVIGFDELCAHSFPGETKALEEALGFDRYRLVHSRFGSVQAYLVIE